MNSPLALNLGGLVMWVRTDNPHLRDRLVERYKVFLTSPSASPHLEAELVAKELAEDGPAQEPVPAFEAGRLLLHGSGVEGWVDAKRGCGRLLLNTSHVLEQTEYFLRAACALIVFEAGGLLLHAAGVVRNGRAFLFIGPSGSGKTTVAGFAGQNDRLLNDDLVLLRPHAGRWVAWATPFSRPPSASLQPLSAPVAAIFRLVQSRDVFAQPLDPARAVAELVAGAPVICADPLRSSALLDRCTLIARQVPCYALHFRREPSFWDVVERVVGGREMPGAGPLAPFELELHL